MSDTIIIPKKGTEEALDWDRTLMVNIGSDDITVSHLTFRQIIAAVVTEAWYNVRENKEGYVDFLKRKNLS